MKELRRVVCGKTIYLGILENPNIPYGVCGNKYENQKYLLLAQKTDDHGNAQHFDRMSYSYTSSTIRADELQIPTIEDYLTMSSILRTHKTRYNKKTHELKIV